MLTTLLNKQNFTNKLYDPLHGNIRHVEYFEKYYGKAILKRIEKETREARKAGFLNPEEAYSKELVEEIRAIMIKKFPTSGFEITKPINMNSIKEFQSFIGVCPEPPEIQDEENIKRRSQKGDEFFIMLKRGVFLNPEFRKIFKGPFTVYAWLWSNIVRKGWIDKKGYPIRKNYYENGLLAYSSSLTKIAKDCFMDKDTVKKYIDLLKEKEIIRVDYICPEGKKQPQGVYILGEWGESDGQITETLYLTHVLLSQKQAWDF
jgi:hypothetical protein